MMTMKLLSIRLLSLLVAFALLPCLCLAAGDAPIDRATLKGLKSVGVIMDPLGPALQERGLSADALVKQIQKRLQDAGIQVSDDATEFVGLRVLSAQAKRTSYAISISLSLYQRVELVRDRALKSSTDTWGVESVILAQPKEVSESVSETVDELVQRFVASYKSENPATPPAQPQP